MALPVPERPFFISFFCGDAYYARAASALRARCDALGMPILIEAVRDEGAYWRNTLMKPLFIRDKLMALGRDLIWIDVDTTLHADHGDFRNLEADLTLASHSGDLAGVKASPIALAYNPRSLAFMAAWADACRTRLDHGDVDLDHDVLKYEILPAFTGRMTLRLMGDPGHPRDFTEGRTLTNGLSRRSHGAMPHVLAKNRGRSARFAALRLDHFAVADLPQASDPTSPDPSPSARSLPDGRAATSVVTRPLDKRSTWSDTSTAFNRPTGASTSEQH